MTQREESAVARFDPFREFGLGTLGRSWPFPGLFERLESPAGRWAPSVDVSESDDEYVVTAELPGAKKEDVTVELQEDVLTLLGEKKSEREEKGEKRRYVERSYGSFSRSFSLPSNADPDRMHASFEDGVLTIQIGKREDPKSRTISVK